MVPRRRVRFLSQAPSVLITRTNPRVSGYGFTVNRHVSYYPYYYPKRQVYLTSILTNNMTRGYAGAMGGYGRYI